jgi:tetratricopeptide (TPR) repeat protein
MTRETLGSNCVAALAGICLSFLLEDAKPVFAEGDATSQSSSSVMAGRDISLQAGPNGIAIVAGGNVTVTYTYQDLEKDLRRVMYEILSRLDAERAEKAPDFGRQAVLEKQLLDVQSKLINTQAAFDQTKRYLTETADELQRIKGLIPVDKYNEAIQALARNDTSAAERLLKETLDQRRQQIATATAEAAQAAFRLGDIKENKHLDYDAAWKYYNEAMELESRDPSYWSAFGSIAAKLGRYDEAEKSLQQALALLEPKKVSQALVSTLLKLGDVYWEQGKYSIGDIQLSRALESSQLLAPGSFAVAEVLETRALLYWKWGRLPEADEMLNEAAQLAQNAKTESELVILASIYNDQGGLFTATTKFGDAEKKFQDAQRILESVFYDRPRYPLIGDVVNNLAYLAREQGKFDEAIIYVLRARAIFVSVIGKDHPHVAVTYVNEAVSRCGQGRLAEAVVASDEALKIRERSLGTQHPLYGQALAIRGRLFHLQGDHEKAEDYYQRALTVRRASLGDSGIEFAMSLYSLGSLRLDQGRHADADKYLDEARSVILKSNFKDDVLMRAIERATAEAAGQLAPGSNREKMPCAA